MKRRTTQTDVPGSFRYAVSSRLFGLRRARRVVVCLLGLAIVWPLVMPIEIEAQEMEPPSEQTGTPVPEGLEIFLEARMLESQGRYREAAEKYAEAVEAAPEVNEIRVAYASLLFNVGMAESAVGLLDGREDLDWYGKRIFGLALAQAAAGRPDYLARARETLGEAYAERSDDPNLLFALARVYQDLGEIEEAETIVAEMRKMMPSRAQLQVMHGQLLLQLGRSREAAEVFALCAEGDHGSDQCRDGRLQGLVGSNQVGAAGEAMLEWLEADDLDGLLRAADLLFAGNRPVLALDAVQRVLKQEPDSPRANLLEALLLTDLGRYSEAEPRLVRLLKKNPDDIDLLLASAWSAGAGGDGDVEKGRRYLDRAWALVSEDSGSAAAARICLYAARFELATDHGTMAREWLYRISDYDAAGPEMLYLLAESYRRGGNPKDGAAALLRLQPDLPGELQRVAIALEAELRYSAGDINALRRLRPLLDSDDIADRLMAIQVLQATGRWNEVAEESARAATEFGDDRRLLFAQAAGLERADRFDEAVAVFEQLMADDPSDAETANYLGYMYADANTNLDRALTLIRMAVEADPENAAYLDSLGWIEYRLGRLDEAERWIRRALELGGGEDGTVLAHLGEIVLALGRDNEAYDLLQQSLDLGCEHPEHVEELLDTIRGASADDVDP